MASPYIFTNADLQLFNSVSTDFAFYVAFLNPVSITTNWSELTLNADSSWSAPGNTDTASQRIQPYAPTTNMGSNRIAFVNEPLYFSSLSSTTRHDLPVATGSYAWKVTGPTCIYTPYAGNSQLGVAWSSPGIYTVSLSTRDRAGTTTTATRQVYVYKDRASALPGVISISGLSGSLSGGGWQFQCTTVNSQVSLYNPDALPPGTYQPIVVLCETRYEVAPGYWVNATLGPHGHFNPGSPYNDPRILFDGYVQSGSVHQDVDKDTLSFSCAGPQMILQEAKSHQLGYYNCAYTALNAQGVPQGCKQSPIGNGYQVGNLTSADVMHSLLATHCTIAQYHDIHIWNANIPTQPYSATNGTPAVSNMVYSSLSVNEGTIWQGLSDLATNEWAQVYCKADGSICVGPQVNFRGVDYWQQPTLEGPQVAASLINLVQDLGYSVGDSLANMTNALPTLPAQPFPVQFVHPWGHQQNPPQFLRPFDSSNPVNAQILQVQQSLNGPPILCTFSDTPIYDTSSTPTDMQVLYPWITSNWPQDLSIYPVSIDLQENYTGRAALVKLIGTLASNNATWSSWYPQSAFNKTAVGGVSTVVNVLPASDWVVDERHVLPDVTTQQNAILVWNWWWEMAKRALGDRNRNYVGSIVTGLFTGATLGDIVGVTRQNNTLGPRFSNKLFYITDIAYGIDLSSRTWTTTFGLGEVTSSALAPITPPPFAIPK